MTRRHVSYQWRLREIMATRGLFTTTHLAPLLAERGIDAVGLPDPPAGHRHPRTAVAARPRRAL